MKTPCCGHEIDHNRHPVYWNPYNKVIQCHVCGEIYEPAPPLLPDNVEPWVGVDLDGTLAHYEKWGGPSIGEPIPEMVSRVKEWLRQGIKVKIFTARVGPRQAGFDVTEQRRIIGEWCVRVFGQRLEVTATKDFGMTELWDDRCVSVIKNTGKPRNPSPTH